MDSGNPGLPGLWRTRPDLGAAVDLGTGQLTESLGLQGDPTSPS